jgi:hypothetical protein
MNELIRRRGLMSRDALPYDAQVEYLQSTGAERILFSVYVDDYITVRVDFMLLETTQQIRPWSMGHPELYISGQNKFSYYLGAAHATTLTPAVNVLYESNYSFAARSGAVNSSAAACQAHTVGNKTLAIFARNDGNYACKIKVYNVKVWGFGDIKIDAIPVRVGQVGYLYDRVSGQLFGNAGTGDFILGPDVQ